MYRLGSSLLCINRLSQLSTFPSLLSNSFLAITQKERDVYNGRDGSCFEQSQKHEEVKKKARAARDLSACTFRMINAFVFRLDSACTACAAGKFAAAGDIYPVTTCGYLSSSLIRKAKAKARDL